jgi:YegS/Rv2252/BmrU family lipid kinase
MNFNKITFIVNPSAGNGTTGKKWSLIEKLARDKLGVFDYHLTNGPGNAMELTRLAFLRDSDLVICVGGDGTFNEVINGYMDGDTPFKHGVSLGYIPNGTGLDFSKTILIPQKPEDALDMIKNCLTPRLIDLGRITYQDHSGALSNRYFHNIVSFGLGGETVNRVNRSSKLFGGFLTFIWATLVSLLTYKSKRMHITIDSGAHIDVKSLHVAVANGQFQGGGMRIAPQAKMDDGILNTTIIGDLSLLKILLNLYKLYNGKIFTVKNITSLTGKRIEAYSDKKVLIDVDGEQLGSLPITIDVVPGALSLISE